MIATHKVQDSKDTIVGFMADDGLFYTDYFIQDNGKLMDNISIGKGKSKELKLPKDLPSLPYKSLIEKKYKKNSL